MKIECNIKVCAGLSSDRSGSGKLWTGICLLKIRQQNPKIFQEVSTERGRLPPDRNGKELREDGITCWKKRNKVEMAHKLNQALCRT